MKRIILALLTLSFSNNLFAYDDYDDTFYCPKKLVVFWEEFAASYGESTIPAFLVLNNCIDTSYALRQFYISQQLEKYFTNRYVVNGGYDYQVETFDSTTEAITDSDTLEHQHKIEAVSTWHNHDLAPINTVPLSINHNSVEPKQKAPEEKKTTNKQLLIIVIENHRANFVLALALLGSLLVIFCKRFRSNPKSISSRKCPDCGAIIKTNKKQCFICGSYV